MFEVVRRPGLVAISALAMVACAAAQVSTTPLTFPGPTIVGASSAAATVTLTAQTSGTLTSLTALTSGSPHLDFSVVPLSCSIGLSLTSGESCTVSVTFSPLYAGVRQGAVMAQAGSVLLASAPLSGLGQGSLPVLVPGTINTVAGDGDWIYQRDGIPATEAPIFLPSGLAVDANGDLFLCDSSNNRVRRVDAASGFISTVAGDGSAGAAGDGGPATAAQISNPAGVAIDGAGNLFIADSGNNAVRRVDAMTGLITTFAGQLGVAGYQGDGGAATSALLSSPHGLALMPGGDLVISDTGNNAVRLVNITTHQISTIAGTGVAGYNQDGIAATAAELNDPYGVAVRSDGTLAIADLENQRVRLVSPAGIISTAAGTGQRNGGTPVEQQLDGPADVAFDPAGDLFIADAGNNRVRLILATSGAIQTVVGINSEQFTGDGGPADQASIYGPYALFFDAVGNLWLSDTFHNRVRVITGGLLAIPYSTIKVGNVSPPMVEMLYNQGNADLVLSTPVLQEAALDAATTTCNLAAMPPTAACSMGVEFAPTQTGANITGSIHWLSNAPNVSPVDALRGQVLSVDVTSVTLTSSQNPGLLGHAITLTATVTSDDTGRTGTVTFSEGSTTWCAAVTMNGGGSATCSLPGLALGSHSFTAAYSGDANNAASTSAAYTEVVKQQAALVLTAAPNPAVVTSAVTLTLTAVDASGTPTGSIVFYDGSTALATVALNGLGVAQWSTQSLGISTHALSAQYAGDNANIAGTSNTVSEHVTQAVTSTTLTASAGSVTVGTYLAFTATVANTAGTALTGPVAFYDGSTLLGSVVLSPLGTAALTLNALTPGNHAISATYGGDTNDAGSSSAAVAETIAQIATVSALGADVNPLNAGAMLHLTAAVSGAAVDGPLTGSVTFHDGSTALGLVALNAGGQALFTVSTLSVGAHSLWASFAGNTNYGPSNSPAVNQTVQQTATQTALSAVMTTTLAGQTATFHVVVSSATGIPTGQVSLRDGSVVLATQMLSNAGTAAFATSTLAVGLHSMTVAYSGDSNYAASVSALQQQTVLLAQPALTLSGPANAIDAGTGAGFVAVLTSPGIAPTGTMTLWDGSAVVANALVTAAGSFPFSTSSLSIGTHLFTASYSGDAHNSTAASAAVFVMVRQAGSNTVLVGSVSTLTAGTPLTLTATVSSNSPNAGGQVRFFDSSSILGTANLRANQTAALTLTGLGLGSHALTAVYGGDTNHAGSTSAPIAETVLQSATAHLTSDHNPAVSGQSLTLSAQLTGAGSEAPTGSIHLYDNGGLLATLPLNNLGAAGLTTNTLTVGVHTITLSYAGDNNFAAATAQLVETIVQATTNVTVTVSANPATFSLPVNLVAQVSSNGGAATGMVSFTEGGAAVGAASLDASGSAQLTLSTFAPGTHTIVAAYPGDGKAEPSASSPLSFAVKQTTQLTVSSGSNPGWTLTPLTVNATLTHSGPAPATGVIAFTVDSNSAGSAALDGTGNATLSWPGMSAGSHTIAATYAGDGANFAGASPTHNQSVQPLPSSTSITGSAASSSSPQQMILIAVVQGKGSPAPGGTVTFSEGNATLGQAPLQSTGVATLTVVFPQATEQVTASYGGDVNYAASQSTATINAPTVAAAGAPFSLWVSAADITLVTHQHTTITVNVGSAKGFTDTIALGCLGLPSAGTCTFTPSQVTLAANSTVSASLVVDTGNPLGAGAATSAQSGRRRDTFLCCLPLGLLAGLLRRQKRSARWQRLGTLWLVALAAGLTCAGTGCGGLSTNATAPGTYTFKVVGTGQTSGISQTQTITLVVTQ
jgi:hypothetical protein